MSKKFRNELEAMTPDQVTAKLGDYYEAVGNVLADKDSSAKKTTFNMVALSLKSHAKDLISVACKKNGVKQFQSVIETGDAIAFVRQIADAAEARGNNSAVKIREYLRQNDIAIAASKAALQGGTSPIKTYAEYYASWKKLG